MDRDKYDKQLMRWVKNHYWDSLEKDKDLILRHLRTFAVSEESDRIKELEAEVERLKAILYEYQL
uniref:Uncharacterized protein n=1 Tax=viral metagenome TaxID=1070528 RepID=A0A6H2A3G9_9ZZZZ